MQVAINTLTAAKSDCAEVDEVDSIMFNPISNPIQTSNKNKCDVVCLATSDEVFSCGLRACLYTTDI